MLSFEMSAIDLILAIAVIILLILYITKSSVKPPPREKLLVEEKKPSKKSATEATTPEEERKKLMSTQPQTDSTKCPYGFGYLKKLDKGASIPEKCLSCSRIMECYSANE